MPKNKRARLNLADGADAFGFVKAIQLDHLTKAELDEVEAILDKAAKARKGVK